MFLLVSLGIATIALTMVTLLVTHSVLVILVQCEVHREVNCEVRNLGVKFSVISLYFAKLTHTLKLHSINLGHT